MNRLCAYTVALFVLLPASASLGDVAAYEKQISIPTWQIGSPQVHSNFFDAARHDIYPYTLNDVLTSNKIDKKYRGVFLENDYVKILILPEIGGRLHGAVDKTNDYVWFYWQRTIKPGLISMTGAWISGGIEWNFPHGHRPSCFMPVDHRIVKHRDGSATVWVGETEPIYRMRWLVGMTLFPGRSYLRCDYVFVNPTNHKHPFQFWATSATHANEWTQAQFPGRVMTGHGKHNFWNWPIHNGVDLTWWKNTPNATSYFAYKNPSDWFGTYDHRAKGGMVHVANHHVMPGKKLWTWGSGPSGRIWEDILSEGGGPYFEPQAGAFSDNQPDYHWMDPNEVKTAHDYWFPVRDIRGVKNANKDFAVNTELVDDTAFAGVCATRTFCDCRIVLKNAATGAVLARTVQDVGPNCPCILQAKVGNDTSVYDLHLTVSDCRGKVRIELRQQQSKPVDMPTPHHTPGDPDKMTQDELYHSGQWLDKFRRTRKGLAYYHKAIEKDPIDTRVNTELGFYALKQGKWNEALQRLDKALGRDDDNARIYYGKGLAHSGLGDFDKAYAQFYRATYAYSFFSSAHYNLARIDLRRGDVDAALEKLEQAVSQNGKFADIPALRAAALRHAGRHAQALAAANSALRRDPLHFMGGYERIAALKHLGRSSHGWQRTWNRIMRGAVQNYLELAVAYANAGLFRDADAVLEVFSQGKDDTDIHPMVNYFRGYFKRATGDAAAAARFFNKAKKGPVDYTNPHRLEGKAALQAALNFDATDANARLFLGNLLYARGQRSEGLAQWNVAVEHNDRLSHGWRNVGYGERYLKKNLNASYRAYKKCLTVDPRDARALLECDDVAKELKVSLTQRLAFLASYPEAIEARDAVASRLIDLQLVSGDVQNLARAYDLLTKTHFHNWEGKYGIHPCWVEVNQKLGDAAFEKKDFKTALHHYRQACEYPENLEVAAPTPDFRAHVLWNLAKTHLAMNDRAAAFSHLKKVIGEKYTKPHLGTLCQALAHKALGNSNEYRTLLDSLKKRCLNVTSRDARSNGRQAAVAHCLLSLILKEQGDQDGATAEHRKALAHDPRVMRSVIREAQLDVMRARQ